MNETTTISEGFQPYPEYKDSGIDWLGEIPAHWEVKPLKWVISICSGEALSNTLFQLEAVENMPIPVIGGNGIMGYTDRSNVESSCIAIGRVGAQCGNVHLADFPAWITDNALMVSDIQLFSRKYLSLVLECLDLNRWASQNAQPLITGGFVKMQRVCAPSLEEQQAIGRFLDHKTSEIDALIAAKQRLITLLQEKRAALITTAVTKGLDPSAPMKDSGIEWIGRIPTDWSINKLGSLTVIIQDIDHKMPQAVDSGVPFLSAKDLLNDGTLNFTDNVKMISEDDYIQLSRKVAPRRNDIIYSRIGARLGKARLVNTDKRFLVSYSCCVMRTDSEKLNERFARYILDSEMVLTEAKLRTQGIGVPDLGLGEISRFPIPTPPIDQQVPIADYLDDEVKKLRNLIDRVASGIEMLQEYRTVLISAAVTGKIDVRDTI